LTWRNEIIYEGEFHYDKRNDFGVFTYPSDKSIYVGKWKDGKPDGNG
jgi:hypothetical protein